MGVLKPQIGAEIDEHALMANDGRILLRDTEMRSTIVRRSKRQNKTRNGSHPRYVQELVCVRKQSVKSNTKVNQYGANREGAHKDLHC